jgi:hypothetical protein
LPDRIVVPVDQLRAVSQASLAMVDDTRPTATWLDDALARVRATTEAGFRPAAVGDGTTVQTWCDAVAELDGWLGRVADLFEQFDHRSPLFEMMAAPMLGSPALPASPTPSGLAAIMGLPADVSLTTVETFDALRDDLTSSPALLRAWLDALDDDQRTLLYQERWAALLPLAGLSSRQRDDVQAAARARIPRVAQWEELSQRFGWGPLSIGTDMRIERVLEHGGDVYLTLEVSDSLAGQLSRDLSSGAVQITAGGRTTYQLTLQFASMADLDAAMQDLGQAFIPGSDLPWWARGFVRAEPIQPSHLTELRLAQRLDSYRHLVVGEVRSHGLFAEAEVLDELLTGDAGASVGIDRTTGNTIVDGHLMGGVQARALLPDELGLDVGGASARGHRSVELSPTGDLVSTTTTVTLSAAAGATRLSTPRGSVTIGTDHGTQVVYTSTEAADGTRSAMVVIADTSEERFGFSLAPDPRLPRATLEYAAGEAITTRVYVRADDGSWHEVTE